MTLKSEFETTCPCCHATLVIDTNLRRIVRHVEPPTRRPAGAERRASSGGRAGEAARGSLSAVGRRRTNARRRAVEAVRGSAAPGERGADHEADTGLRSGLTREDRVNSESLNADLTSSIQHVRRLEHSALLELLRQFRPPIHPPVVDRLCVRNCARYSRYRLRRRSIRASDVCSRRCGQSSSIRSTFHTFAGRQPPVVVADVAQVGDGVARDAAAEIHVRIHVAERERARRREDRLSAVQAGIARSSRSIPTGRAVDTRRARDRARRSTRTTGRAAASRAARGSRPR